MDGQSRLMDPFNSELPMFSADWRLLLPIRPGCRILVLNEKGEDFIRYFSGLEMTVVVWQPGLPSLAGGDERGRTSSVDPVRQEHILFRLLALPFTQSSFDVVALPFGIPLGELAALGGAVGGLRALSVLLKPGGRLLLGFVNPWGIRRPRAPGQVTLTVAAMRKSLRRSGLNLLSLHGVVPDLADPEYVLPPGDRTLGFFLQHRLSGKPLASLLLRLPMPLLSSLLFRLLPCYYVIATI